MNWETKVEIINKTVKNLSAMQETLVWSLCWEYSLEKEMAMYCNMPAWRIPWTEEPGGLQTMGLQRAGLDRVTKHANFIIIIILMI